MNKKVIIISIGVVIFAVAATVGILLLINSSKPQADISKAGPTKLSADGTPDYGACTILKKDFIKSTLGEPAASLQGPDTVGLALLASGDQVQVCSYAFITGGTAANQFNNTNAFTVEVFLHKDKASEDAFIASRDKTLTSLSGIGEKATYEMQKFSDGRISYILMVYSGLRHYTFSINQPSDLKKFTNDSAKAVLTKIAQSLNY